MHDEWQDIDTEAAQAAVFSKHHCTYVSTTGVNVLDGMLPRTLLNLLCCVMHLIVVCCSVLSEIVCHSY